VGATHDPPQMLPAPQSALDAQALALQIVPLHLADGSVPQSASTEHAAAGVHVAMVHVPLGQSVSTLQFDCAHVAPWHVLPSTGQSVSMWHVSVLHVAPAQRPLDAHDVSAVHVGALLHLAPLHAWLEGHPASPVHAPELLHLAPLQTVPTVQAASELQVLGTHVAPLQRPPLVPQSISTLQTPEVQVFVARLQMPPEPH